MSGRYTRSVEERLMEKVEITDSCWLWTGGHRAYRYGQIKIDGKHQAAHRVSYELHKGPIPEGLEIDDLCGNGFCVNPDHLEAVTHTENVRRGRLTKLTEDLVADIRRRLEAGEVGAQIGRDLGVSKQTISAIRTGQNWRAAA